MGFDEYLDLADQLGADPYVVLNYDSANKRDWDKSATLEEVRALSLHPLLPLPTSGTTTAPSPTSV
jgi:hypothetical protein